MLIVRFQAHIVSVILDVLNPEQKEEEDFHIQIEKDPAQEDFLQGRMTGNPYKSTDVGLGPLMRDIKNKICRDTEMIALMEDDNGMELLVNNQIISLSLPVRAVYDKLWKKANPGQPMVIVYRMRGLLGDAVESFVSTLGEADGGRYSSSIDSARLGSIFIHFVCMLSKRTGTTIQSLELFLEPNNPSGWSEFEILGDCYVLGTESVNKFCAQVSRVIGNLVVGNEEAEKALIAMYIKTCQWKEIDETNSCNSFKACSHLVSNHPPLYSATESQEWKAFLLRPSLKLMLSFMHGMAKSHEASQRALAEKTLHILHRLEQVASDNSIGTMAENVVEALKENTEVAAQIENVRQETRQKKRQMAMAMRNKQLREMGMQMGKSGEVKVAHRRIANEPALEGVTDPLASCCIC
ncbi:unnamed protein product, partial [Haemonchus placei]|uniref:E3 ubiquitin-protein ligase n=1 Tax=Haemonchus placei TaxID=6290 RepID=A0A0N4WVI5_HAEPC